ncbi:MAG: hypothetical protein JSV54_03825 [Chloroflexota bacterium]|nr:MAG: hypothetical protein JSV54_03825 [Chloroflexota bacterium]
MRHRFTHYIFIFVGIVLAISLVACRGEQEPQGPVPAVQWSQTFGENGDEGHSVQQTTDGGYIVCGITDTHEASYEDIWLIKTDAEGNKVWDKTFGGDGFDGGNVVQQTTDGGYIICGYTSSYGSGGRDMWLIKTDAEGNKTWDKTFGQRYRTEVANVVQQTTDGGYILCGNIESYGSDKKDIWLIKTDGDGNKVWDKTFGGVENDEGRSVQQTEDGGYIVCGVTGESFSALLIKTDANGGKLWDKIFEQGVGNAVQQTADGGYVICGNTSFPLVYIKIWLIKTDANGNKIWNREFGGRITVSGAVQQTKDGGYIVCGCEYSSGSRIWLIKTDANGDKLWDGKYGVKRWSSGGSIQQTTDSGFIVCGQTTSQRAGGESILLLKIAPEQ